MFVRRWLRSPRGQACHKNRRTGRPPVTARFKPRLVALEGRAVPAALYADFDGDGCDDLAVGAPFANAVHVVYGQPTGLLSSNAETYTQESLGVGASENNDLFGRALAAGDFDHDGLDDLAVGAPGETAFGTLDEGVVYVLYGSPRGLGAAVVQQWDRHTPGIGEDGLDDSAASYGSALAAGDFDGDGTDDLAVGAPRASFTMTPVGAVHVLYGSGSGLSADGNQWWHQNQAGVLGNAETNDYFGIALAVGNFNGDRRDDLAVGVPGERVLGLHTAGATRLLLVGHAAAGAVQVLYGSAGGLSATDNQLWSQDSPGVGGAVEAGDQFGRSLAVGDFNGDRKDDLAVGVPYEDVGTAIDAGAVNVLYGSAQRLTATGSQLWTEDSPDVHSFAMANEWFGFALVAGDFDGDGFAELAVGTPGESVVAAGAGGVHVLSGRKTGLVATTQFFDAFGLHHGLSVAGDQFGFALAVGDYDGNGVADLAIGIPGLDVGGVTDAGAVQVWYGRNTYGLAGAPPASGVFVLDPLVDPDGDPDDRFGFAL